MRNTETIATGVCLAALMLSGCGAREADLYARLQHEDPSVRIEAMRQAVRLGDDAALPYLVENLNDSDADVRLFAIVALERMTGERMSYEHYAPAGRRRESIERWRRWLSESVASADEAANER